MNTTVVVGVAVRKSEILLWQKQFRLLRGWKIRYLDDGHHNGMMAISDKDRTADIYPCPCKVAMPDYLLHEILHLALKQIKNRVTEEMCVQDILRLLKLDRINVITKSLPQKPKPITIGATK